MTDQFKWEGDVLRGPFRLLVDRRLTFPAGPAESAPFDTGAWWVSYNKVGSSSKWQMSYGWSSNVSRPRDLVVRWNVVNLANHANPKEIAEVDAIGIPLSKAYSRQTDTPVEEWPIDEHVEVGSEFEMAVECPSLSGLKKGADLPTIAGHLHALMSLSEAFDVEITFADGSPPLRSRSTLLCAECPRLNQLLSDVRPSKDVVFESDDGTQPPFELEVKARVRPPSNSKAYTIAVTGFTRCTLAATLVWLVTKYITFAIAADDDDDDNNNGPPPVKRRKNAAGIPPPDPPPPAAPWEEVYRLATVLEVPALRSAALGGFGRGLTVDGVAEGLFVGMGAQEPEARAAAMRFAVENWAEVKGTKGMKEMLRRVKAGELEGGMEVATELVSRL